MLIDFHTHIFPDALAPKGLAVLRENSSNIYETVTDMTAAGLLAYMDKAGVDISVVQPVVTKPSQVVKTNTWAAALADSSNGRLISFGGIYPVSDDYREQIDFVASLGLPGIKFHAEYQSFTVDEPHMLRVYDYAASKGLIMLHHGGFDPGFKVPYHTSPQGFANVLRELKGGTLIAAHLGGHAMWDDVERYLCGTDIYLDTSMGFSYYPREQFVRIVRAHGADKILFASDSPWSDAKAEAAALDETSLTPAEKNAIRSDNAVRLFNL